MLLLCSAYRQLLVPFEFRKNVPENVKKSQKINYYQWFHHYPRWSISNWKRCSIKCNDLLVHQMQGKIRSNTRTPTRYFDIKQWKHLLFRIFTAQIYHITISMANEWKKKRRRWCPYSKCKRKHILGTTKIADRTNRGGFDGSHWKCLLCLLISVMDTKSKIQS